MAHQLPNVVSTAVNVIGTSGLLAARLSGQPRSREAAPDPVAAPPAAAELEVSTARSKHDSQHQLSIKMISASTVGTMRASAGVYAVSCSSVEYQHCIAQQPHCPHVTLLVLPWVLAGSSRQNAFAKQADSRHVEHCEAVER
jgi:hypothetical protein